VPDNDLNQIARFTHLLEAGREGVLTGPLKVVYPELTNQKEWMDTAYQYIQEGYEGAILRSLRNEWLPKRTVEMLKFKPTEIDEYIILGINEAIDKYGSLKGMAGSFTVKPLDHSQSFDVGAGKLTHPERKVIWQNRGEFIGSTLIVKHEPVTTSGGVPICAVAVKIKER
jgi:ATP-dependent DNA ligase